jgi:hypothetical protein
MPIRTFKEGFLKGKKECLLRNTNFTLYFDCTKNELSFCVKKDKKEIKLNFQINNLEELKELFQTLINLSNSIEATYQNYQKNSYLQTFVRE